MINCPKPLSGRISCRDDDGTATLGLALDKAYDLGVILNQPVDPPIRASREVEDREGRLQDHVIVGRWSRGADSRR